MDLGRSILNKIRILLLAPSRTLSVRRFRGLPRSGYGATRWASDPTPHRARQNRHPDGSVPGEWPSGSVTDRVHSGTQPPVANLMFFEPQTDFLTSPPLGGMKYPTATTRSSNNVSSIGSAIDGPWTVLWEGVSALSRLDKVELRSTVRSLVHNLRGPVVPLVLLVRHGFRGRSTGPFRRLRDLRRDSLGRRS
jgi:hypothetical protein